MATLKITGVDAETAAFVEERARLLHFKGQAEYLRNLIREDRIRVERERSSEIFDILGPIHARSEKDGVTDRQIAEAVEAARSAVAKKGKRSSNAA